MTPELRLPLLVREAVHRTQPPTLPARHGPVYSRLHDCPPSKHTAHSHTPTHPAPHLWHLQHTRPPTLHLCSPPALQPSSPHTRHHARARLAPLQPPTPLGAVQPPPPLSPHTHHHAHARRLLQPSHSPPRPRPPTPPALTLTTTPTPADSSSSFLSTSMVPTCECASVRVQVRECGSVYTGVCVCVCVCVCVRRAGSVGVCAWECVIGRGHACNRGRGRVHRTRHLPRWLRTRAPNRNCAVAIALAVERNPPIPSRLRACGGVPMSLAICVRPTALDSPRPIRQPPPPAGRAGRHTPRYPGMARTPRRSPCNHLVLHLKLGSSTTSHGRRQSLPKPLPLCPPCGSPCAGTQTRRPAARCSVGVWARREDDGALVSGRQAIGAGGSGEAPPQS